MNHLIQMLDFLFRILHLLADIARKEFISRNIMAVLLIEDLFILQLGNHLFGRDTGQAGHIRDIDVPLLGHGNGKRFLHSIHMLRRTVGVDGTLRKDGRLSFKLPFAIIKFQGLQDRPARIFLHRLAERAVRLESTKALHVMVVHLGKLCLKVLKLLVGAVTELRSKEFLHFLADSNRRYHRGADGLGNRIARPCLRGRDFLSIRAKVNQLIVFQIIAERFRRTGNRRLLRLRQRLFGRSIGRKHADLFFQILRDEL